VWKTINGVEVLMHDTGGDTYGGNVLIWPKSSVAGTLATLRYRPQGSSGAWTTLTSAAGGGIETRGSTYLTNLGALPADQYQYELIYARPGESVPYAQSSGVFALNTAKLTGSQNIVAVVDKPFLDLDFTSAELYATPDSESWSGTNIIELNWQSLEALGDGNVRVSVNYTKKNYYTVYDSNNVEAATWNETFSAADAARGVSLRWLPPAVISGFGGYNGIAGVSRVQVWKTINGVEVLMHDTGGDQTRPERLILQGKTSGLTGINIVGVGTRVATALGGGLYTVDLSNLAPGTYTYTPIGTTSLLGARFTVNGANSTPTVRESADFLDLDFTSAELYATPDSESWSGTNIIELNWQSLEALGDGNVRVSVNYTKKNYYTVYDSNNVEAATWNETFSAADAARGVSLRWLPPAVISGFGGYNGIAGVSRVQVWKTINGVEVLMHDTGVDQNARRLQITSLPSTTQSVSFEYRRANSTDPYLTKAATKIATGWFTASYDDIPVGTYDYKLIINGNTANPITGTIDIKRGAQTLAATGSTASVTYAPVLTQTLDRWGNVLSVSDPRNAAWVTRYRYDQSGHQIEETKPQVTAYDNNGNPFTVAPKTVYAYDALGRRIAITDANGHSNVMQYDDAGQLIAEIHADGGVNRTVYDTLGRKIAMIDAAGNKTDLVYDRNNRLTQSRNALGETDKFKYDELGHRIAVTNAANETSQFFYDLRGNLIKSRLPLGQETYLSYDAWGHKIREAHSGTTDVTTWVYSYFHRLEEHTDAGRASYQYRYDSANRLLQQTNTRGQNLVYAYYANGQLQRIADQGTASGDLQATRSETWYEYDAAGHRTREGYAQFDPATRGFVTNQDARLAYDALGRLSRYSDVHASIDYQYDAVGNRRHTSATYRDKNLTPTTKDYWYRYDSMDRIIISQGALVNGQIQIRAAQGTQAAQGIELGYDGASNRRTAVYYDTAGIKVTENYLYDKANRLTSSYRLNGQARIYTSERYYDSAGRVAQVVTYSSPGVKSGIQQYTYNENGWLRTQVNKDGAGTVTSTIDRSQAGDYAFDGRALKYRVVTPGYTNTYTTTYRAFEGYRENYVDGGSTYFQSGKTNFTYDVNGNLTRVTDATDGNRTRSFINNPAGQIIEKTDYLGKHQYYYYASGAPVGSSGDLTSADFDYNYTPVSDSYPATTPSQYTVNTGDSLLSVALAVYGDSKLWYLIADANGLNAGSALTAGQTLKIPNKITNIHNDSSTFKPYSPGDIIGDTTPNLADPPPPPQPKGGGCGVVGLIIMIVVAIVVTIVTAGAALAAIAPAATGAATGLAATFAAGAAALTGGIGSLAAVAASAIGAAVGSIASQLVGVATGNVEKFSWGAVATSALTAGIGATGVLSTVSGAISGVIPGGGTALGQAVVGGVVNNVVNQGVNILTGQQKQFSWSGLAISALGAAASYGIDKAFGVTPTQEVGQFKSFSSSLDGKNFEWGNFARSVGSELTKSAARQAITIAVNKSGKMNWEQVAADGFGNAIGNAIVDQAKYNASIERKVNALMNASIDRALADPNNPFNRSSSSSSGREVPNFTQSKDGQFRDQNGNLAPYGRASNEETRNEGTGLLGDVEFGGSGTEGAKVNDLDLDAVDSSFDFYNGLIAGRGRTPTVEGDVNGEYSIRFSGNSRLSPSDVTGAGSDFLRTTTGGLYDLLNPDSSPHGLWPLDPLPTQSNPAQRILDYEKNHLRGLMYGPGCYCNDIVEQAFLFGAEEKIGRFRSDQIQYFKSNDRWITDQNGGQRGYAAFFGDDAPFKGHEVLVYDRKEVDGEVYYGFTGARSTGKLSGPLTSAQDKPTYVKITDNGVGYGYSLDNGKLVPWKQPVLGYEKFNGFGAPK